MALPPLTPLRRFDTHRLLPAKYSDHFDSVLTRLVDESQSPGTAQDDLQRIFELDHATNSRLLAENGRVLGVDARELVVDVPQAHIINAAFTHPNPLGARFSSSERGAWYASFELSTSKAEVLFHKTIEYAEIDWKEREEVVYDDYLADFTASFHDIRNSALRLSQETIADPLAEHASLSGRWAGTLELRPGPQHPEVAGALEQLAASTSRPEDAAELDSRFEACLSPISYVESQHLAKELLDAGSLGLVYPSVRKRGGTCIACFRPAIVSNVRKGARYKLVWTPNRATMTRC